MKNTAKIKTGCLFFLIAFVSSCQNDNLFTSGIDNHIISRSDDVSADTIVLKTAQDSYYWVEHTKVPLHKIEGKYFVIYDDSSTEAIETAMRQGHITIQKTLGQIGMEQSTFSNNDLDDTCTNNLRHIIIQGDTSIEKTLLSKVSYWTPYYRMSNGNEVRIDNRFFVKLKSDDDFELLSGFAKKIQWK